VALGPQANYTDWATAICRRNLVATFVDRGVSRGENIIHHFKLRIMHILFQIMLFSNDTSIYIFSRYSHEDLWFETRWDQLCLSVYLILPATLGPGVYSASNRNEYQKQK
jgi:hypothetical protein